MPTSFPYNTSPPSAIAGARDDAVIPKSDATGQRPTSPATARKTSVATQQTKGIARLAARSNSSSPSPRTVAEGSTRDTPSGNNRGSSAYLGHATALSHSSPPSRSRDAARSNVRQQGNLAASSSGIPRRSISNATDGGTPILRTTPKRPPQLPTSKSSDRWGSLSQPSPAVPARRPSGIPLPTSRRPSTTNESLPPSRTSQPLSVRSTGSRDALLSSGGTSVLASGKAASFGPADSEQSEVAIPRRISSVSPTPDMSSSSRIPPRHGSLAESERSRLQAISLAKSAPPPRISATDGTHSVSAQAASEVKSRNQSPQLNVISPSIQDGVKDRSRASSTSATSTLHPVDGAQRDEAVIESGADMSDPHREDTVLQDTASVTVSLSPALPALPRRSPSPSVSSQGRLSPPTNGLAHPLSTSPRLNRKLPGLRIITPSPSRAPSVTTASLGHRASHDERPSPPIPIKSPLRSASHTSAAPPSHRETAERAAVVTPLENAASIRIGDEDPGDRPSVPGREMRLLHDDSVLEHVEGEVAFQQASFATSSNVAKSRQTNRSAAAFDVMTPKSEGVSDNSRRASRRDSFGWGQKKESTLSDACTMSRLPVTLGAMSDSRHENFYSAVKLPSPSMLQLPVGKAARTLGLDHPSMVRSVTEPTVPLVSPVAADNDSVLSAGLISKRAHLIREIASTERAHATDLALIRDAYITPHMRSSLTNVDGDHPTLTSDASDGSRRSSVLTLQTIDTKHSSGLESSDGWSVAPVGHALPKLSGEAHGGDGRQPQANASAPSLLTPLRSPSFHPSTPTLVGRRLTAADLKAVFLNVDQLATLADELATEFERAIGAPDDDDSAQHRSGDGGNDRLGDVFTRLLPRLRPLYIFYCSRQSQASVRLSEIQAEPDLAAFLADCWSHIKDHTHAWNLDSMLIKPVQRITKYPLLFDDLLANTTPVHPDYFAIRAAAESARALAFEVDETKRRKDVIQNVIAKRSSSQAAKDGKLLGLKRFKRPPQISTLHEPDAPTDVSQASLALLKELSAKLDEGDQCVRRVGRDMLAWTSNARVVLSAQAGMADSFLRIYRLGATNDIPKITALKIHMNDEIGSAWNKLNEIVRTAVVVALGRLLESTRNPRTVIAKRDSKAADYGRYLALRDARKPIDKSLLQSAADFVAMHTQLIDELPVFIHWYTRIFDSALAAFAKAQAEFYGSLRHASTLFLIQHATESDHDVALLNPRSIVKVWHEAWQPYDHAIENLNCTRATASRVASFNARHDNGSVSPALRHSPSSLSARSRDWTDDPASSATSRQRASSLVGDTPESPVRPSRFGLLRRSSQVTIAQSAGLSSPTRPATNRPTSLVTLSDGSNRFSFGLPRIPSDPTKPMFEGLGLSPTKSGTHSSPSLTASAFDGLGLGGPARGNRRYTGHPYTASSSLATSTTSGEVDAAEGWRNEKVLYQCACVANFDPIELGDRRYRGLPFISMESGDLIDVFHEVGRIDELPSFPYPQVGVDNDGVLRTEQ